MSRVGLEALAARCEAATGPDRELDEMIAPTVGLRVVDEGHPLGRRCYDRSHRLVVLPRFTASLDAAMTLAHPSWWLRMGGPLSPAAYGYARREECVLRAGFDMIGPPYSSGATAATLPLALCAAALRARVLLSEKDTSYD